MRGVEKTLLKNIVRLNFIGRCGIVYVIYIYILYKYNYKYINIIIYYINKYRLHRLWAKAPFYFNLKLCYYLVSDFKGGRKMIFSGILFNVVQIILCFVFFVTIVYSIGNSRIKDKIVYFVFSMVTLIGMISIRLLQIFLGI